MLSDAHPADLPGRLGRRWGDGPPPHLARFAPHDLPGRADLDLPPEDRDPLRPAIRGHRDRGGRLHSLPRAVAHPGGSGHPLGDGERSAATGSTPTCRTSSPGCGLHRWHGGARAGLQAPDPHTLVVHLTRPTGDLGPAPRLSPARPHPGQPGPSGRSPGGRPGPRLRLREVIVSSGPYMFEGSEDLSFHAPPEDQRPASGNGATMATLVRNPSWSRASDPIRAAWSDRIEFYPVDSGTPGRDSSGRGPSTGAQLGGGRGGDGPMAGRPRAARPGRRGSRPTGSGSSA